MKRADSETTPDAGSGADSAPDTDSDSDSEAGAPVLIFDGDCPYCSVAAVALRRLDGVVAVPWDADPVGPFLDAQFGARPFAMVFVDPAESRVYAGRAAAEELAERAGTPGIVGGLVRDNYDRIASVVGTLSGRDRDPDDYHEAYSLAADARELLGDLRAAASDPPAPPKDAGGSENGEDPSP
ncbi:hypothetical protein JCM17823_10280 [Halorubrum gandharaense]